jgi:hypothetical protein
LAEKAFVPATELACAFISNFERRYRGIEFLLEHAVTSGMHTKPLLILKVGS